MINFQHLDGEELIAHGWSFETKEEADLFAATVLEELQVRIGQAIADQVGLSKVEEFDLCDNDEEARMWLKKNCPNFQEIVYEQQHLLEEEMITYRDKVPGLIRDASDSKQKS